MLKVLDVSEEMGRKRHGNARILQGIFIIPSSLMLWNGLWHAFELLLAWCLIEQHAFEQGSMVGCMHFARDRS